MPTYDYHCKKCDHAFEYTRPFGSKREPTCPKCHSKETEKQFSAPTIVFKGSGFYKTDSAGSNSVTSKPEEPKKEDTPKKTEAKKDAPKPKKGDK